MAELLKAGVKCRMLRVVPTACHRCENNPENKAKEANAELVAAWRPELMQASFLHDAVRMGLIRDLRELTPDEFDALRVYWWEMEKILRKAGVQLVKI